MTHALTQLAAKYGVTLTERDIAAMPDARRREATPQRNEVTMKSLRRHADRAQRDARMARRRRWVASGWLPPQIAARFTTGELAALSVIAREVHRSGECQLAITHLAALAGIGRTTVQNAVRAGQRLGIIAVTERRHPGRRSETNVVRIVSREWSAWLARRARPIGFKSLNASLKRESKERLPDTRNPDTVPGRKEGCRDGPECQGPSRPENDRLADSEP